MGAGWKWCVTKQMLRVGGGEGGEKVEVGEVLQTKKTKRFKMVITKLGGLSLCFCFACTISHHAYAILTVSVNVKSRERERRGEQTVQKLSEGERIAGPTVFVEFRPFSKLRCHLHSNLLPFNLLIQFEDTTPILFLFFFLFFSSV